MTHEPAAPAQGLGDARRQLGEPIDGKGPGIGMEMGEDLPRSLAGSDDSNGLEIHGRVLGGQPQEELTVSPAVIQGLTERSRVAPESEPQRRRPGGESVGESDDLGIPAFRWATTPGLLPPLEEELDEEPPPLAGAGRSTSVEMSRPRNGPATKGTLPRRSKPLRPFPTRVTGSIRSVRSEDSGPAHEPLTSEDSTRTTGLPATRSKISWAIPSVASTHSPGAELPSVRRTRAVPGPNTAPPLG